MGNNDLLAGELARLRRGAHQFLCRHAAGAWAHQHDGARWHITLPPDLTSLPEHQRFRAHARHEAGRVAAARLYDVDAEITAGAVVLAAAIRQGRHEQAVTAAGHGQVAATLGVAAPAAAGFVRWRDRGGIGCNSLGAPVVACHWGPVAGEGIWLAWWADGPAVAAGFAEQARAAGQHLSVGLVTRIFGPLWYDHQDLLRPAGDIAGQGDRVPKPGPAGADASGPGGEAGTPGLVLLYTTLATWQLLASPDVVHLSRHPVPAAEQAADRAAGLRSGPVTVATMARTR